MSTPHFPRPLRITKRAPLIFPRRPREEVRPALAVHACPVCHGARRVPFLAHGGEGGGTTACSACFDTAP